MWRSHRIPSRQRSGPMSSGTWSYPKVTTIRLCGLTTIAILWRQALTDRRTITTRNNEHSVKQLSCHKKSRTEDYFDDILRSHIWRCELRIKRAVSEKYGGSIDEIIKSQGRICQDHLQWRQINRKRLRGLRMDFKRRKELEDGFVIHAINQLVQRGIDNAEVRRSWVLPIDKMACKYMTWKRDTEIIDISSLVPFLFLSIVPQGTIPIR